MQTIKSALGFPNGTPIDALQGRFTAVYEHKEIQTTYGPKTVQSGFIEDGLGGKMKFKAWSQPDLTSFKGKEILLRAAGNGKGLAVKHDSYESNGAPKMDIIIEIGKTAVVQPIVVQSNSQVVGGTPQGNQNPVKATERPCTGKCEESHTRIHGATAGAAVNKAIDILLNTGHGHAYELAKSGKLEDEIVKIGSQIVRAALKLESGNLAPVAPVAEKTEDVPF